MQVEPLLEVRRITLPYCWLRFGCVISGGWTDGFHRLVKAQGVEKNNGQGIQSDLFYPLVGGHLSFKRVT